MATHNITDGTGGLDASIFYELDRAEVQAFSSTVERPLTVRRTSEQDKSTALSTFRMQLRSI